MVVSREEGDILQVAIRARSVEALKRLMREQPLDYGCRPAPRPGDDGGFVLNAFMTEEQTEALRRSGYEVEVLRNETAFDRERGAEVGEGDRFEGGRVVPRGFGDKTGGRPQSGEKDAGS